MSSGRVIHPVTFFRRRNLRPQHFAFASATRAAQGRTRTVGPAVYVTQSLTEEAIERRVVVGKLGDPVSRLSPPVDPPPEARLFGTSAALDGWVVWDTEVRKSARAAAQAVASGAVLADLLDDYAIIDAVKAKLPSQLVIAVLYALDINNRPGIAAVIRKTLIAAGPRPPGPEVLLPQDPANFTPKETTRHLTGLGVAAAEGSNRRLACERVLLVLLARAFAGPASPVSRPTPAGIEDLVVESDLAPGGFAESVVRAVVDA